MTVEKRNPYAANREKYPNAGRPWNRQDDEELRRLFESGNGIDDLALTFARSPKAVRLRLERMGLIDAALQRSPAPPGS
jgi:ATP-dependent DNA helicase RecQ